MKTRIKWMICALSLVATTVWAEEPVMTQLSCDDFNPSAEALERFKDLKGACEGVVERNGELYGLFKAIVRRSSSRSVVLYLPATDHTFTVEPQSDARVLLGGEKTRPRDLVRGQEIRIYLSVSSFATPDVQEIVLVSDANVMIEHTVAPVEALPTTASPWPAMGLASLMLLGAGWLMRRRRLNQIVGV
jgi:uncharacterized protein (TIGR03382 family)